MKTVFLPVSPLSKKILLHKYGPCEPVKLTNGLGEYDFLFLDRDPRDNLKSIERRMKSVVTLKVADDRARHVQRVGHQIGFALHRFHLSLMMNFIFGRWISRMEAKASIYEFYNFYGITEDDYPSETAYRKWTRFLSKYLQEYKPQRRKKRDQVGELTAPGIQMIPMTIEAINEKVAELLNEHLELFIPANSVVISKTLFSQAYMYYLHQFGKISHTKLAELTDTPRRTVTSRIHAFRNLIETIPAVKRSVMGG